MTNLQIEHNGKKYTWVGDKWGDFKIGSGLDIIQSTVYVWSLDLAIWMDTYHTTEQLVKLGYLEELKENEEKPEGSVWVIEEDLQKMIRLLNDKNKDHSIIEKLREELERRIEEYSGWEKSGKDHPEGTDYANGAYFAYKNIEMFLSSLEQPIEPLQEIIEELPKFDYEKIEENVRAIEFEKIDECRHIMGHIGHHLELITNYLRKLK